MLLAVINELPLKFIWQFAEAFEVKYVTPGPIKSIFIIPAEAFVLIVTASDSCEVKDTLLKDVAAILIGEPVAETILSVANVEAI